MSDPRPCLLCRRPLHPTDLRCCVTCVGLVRRQLRSIPGLVALGEQVLAEPASPSYDGSRGGDDELPGGDLLVLLGPGAPTGAGHPSDPMPVLHTLATWVRDWAETRGEDTLPLPDPGDLCGWLSQRAGWAASYHDAFDEFARDLRQVVTALEDATGAGDRPETGAPCLSCQALLVRDHDDRLGRGDGWQCPRCRRTYDPVQYGLAVASQLAEYHAMLEAETAVAG